MTRIVAGKVLLWHSVSCLCRTCRKHDQGMAAVGRDNGFTQGRFIRRPSRTDAVSAHP